VRAAFIGGFPAFSRMFSLPPSPPDPVRTLVRLIPTLYRRCHRPESGRGSHAEQ